MKTQYITDSKIKNFISAAKEIFDNENCLKIELMRCIGEHPNGSKEQLFFLKVFEEVFGSSRLPVVNPFSRQKSLHVIKRIRKLQQYERV